MSKKWRTEKVEGATSLKKRNEIFTAFQNSDEIQLIVAHPKTPAHGLTLTASHTATWFAPTIFPDIYEQASGRFTRISQTQKVTIINMYCSKREREAFNRLQEKRNMQGLLLEAFEAGETL